MLRRLKAWAGPRSPAAAICDMVVEIAPGPQSPPILLSAPAPLRSDVKGKDGSCLSSSLKVDFGAHDSGCVGVTYRPKER
jgi:hypothetical protein